MEGAVEVLLVPCRNVTVFLQAEHVKTTGTVLYYEVVPNSPQRAKDGAKPTCEKATSNRIDARIDALKKTKKPQQPKEELTLLLFT